jgi:hypothetical protein
MLGAMSNGKIPFDPKTSDLDTVRQIIFERLRRDPGWNQLGKTGDGFAPYVDYVGTSEFERQNARHQLVFLSHEVFWQLVVEGVLAPGMDDNNIDLPWFHVTKFGREVLASASPPPYDPTGYLARLNERIGSADQTVVAYLVESLETFRKGSRVASIVMLGIAAERVFLLLCDSLAAALASSTEKSKFTKILDRFPMKPKLDWVHNKIQQIQAQSRPGFPDNATIMLVAIYDLMRCQRNDLGHPRAMPPSVRREDAFVNLQIFPHYYETAEQVRIYLATNPV